MDQVIFIKRGALNPAQIKQLKNAGVVAIQLDDPKVITEAVTVPVMRDETELLDALLYAAESVGGNFYHYFGACLFNNVKKRREAQRVAAKARAGD